MRTVEEIGQDIRHATSINDAEALYTCAAEMLAHDTSVAKATAFNALGTADLLTGNYASALEHFNLALALSEELGDRTRTAGVIGNIGSVYYSIGNYPLALEYMHRAQEVHEELGDRSAVARAIGNIGNVYSSTGDYPAALESMRRALAVHEELGNRAAVARVTGNVGGVYFRTGDYPLALENLRNALTMHEELGDLAGVARVTGNIGLVYASTGDHHTALEHARRTLAMLEELGDLAGVAFVMGGMIGTLIELARYDEVATLLEQQSTMSMDDPVVRAQHLLNSAMLAEHREDLDAAQRHLLTALTICIEAGLRDVSAECHKRLRDLAQKRNDFAGFIEHNAEYLRISEEVSGKEATQRMAMMEAERKMEGERREREKERVLLYGALPKSIADRMIRGEDVSGDHFEHAAVMFLDIVGFTTNTASMPPADVVKMLERLFSSIDIVCDIHNVVKVKTIGDSYMCFRGDADTTTNAQSIANVGLEVMKSEYTWPNGSVLMFRSGMHIGPATAGVIGTQRLQYDVWGDTVNVASRMESSGEPGRIHVSEAFATALRSVDGGQWTVDPHNDSVTSDSMTLFKRGEISIKGKGPMTTYWLEGTE